MRGPLTRYLRDSVRLGFWDEDNLYGSVIPVSSSGHCNVAFCLRSYHIPRCASFRALCFFNFILGMFGSEPGEMAPKSSKVVVLPKFDMHIYTFELTSAKLKAAVEEYCIPLDLHPRLPHPDMTMNRLPSRYIRIYIEQLEQEGLRVLFSSFFLAVIKHFGVHVSQLVPMGRCSKEVTSSLKGWKKKFFLIDRRAITDVMPWRNGDTDLHDDFLTYYNVSDAARLSEVLVPLRPPPRHLLYVCGLTTACRHPEVRYDIKDQHSNVIDMDTFLKLPSWTGTIVSRGDPIPDDQRPKPRVTPPLKAGAKIPDLTAFQKNLEKPNSKIAAARERKEKQNLAKAEAKHSGTEANEGPKKKQRVQKHHVSIQYGSEGTLSVTPLHQAEPEVVREPTPSVGATVAGSHVKKEVDLSGDTRVPTPPVATTQPSAHTEPPTAQKPATSKGHSSQSSHPGHEDEQVNNRYVPNWGLQNDLRVCTFRAYRELVSHLATPAEDKFLGGLSNLEVISRAYQTLDRLRLSLQRATQENEGLSNKLSLLDSAHSECPSREKELLERLKDLERERDEWRLAVVEGKIKGLENEKLALSAKVAQAEADRRSIVQEFIPTVVKRLHTSVEYRQSLAALASLCFTAGWLGGLSLGRSEDEIAQILFESEDLDIEGSKSWEAKHRELFTKSYPYIQKISDSYDLPMDELLKVSPDVPSATDKGNTSRVGTGEASQQLPPSAL
ncbi:hypothetical protein Tco_0452581 [Tanacetum coccineum]